jgi:GT2 family glycosyltransferase
MKSVCVVTVTYGNRAHLLEQVVDSCIKENVNRIVVVDNGSQEESKEKLIELVSVNGTLIDLVSLNENLGSAGGFKLGLKRARETSKCDYLWLLDDDNVPQEGALKSLFSANSYLSPFRKLVLVSYRKIMSKELGVIDKKDIFKSVSEGEVLGEKRKMAKKIINKIFGTKKVTGEIVAPIMKRCHASYGGMFMATEALDEIGYPNEDFYLYADDIEYSRRFIRAGYQIFTCYFSQIVDVDAQLGSEGFFSSSQSELKVYYSLRNHYYLEGSKSNLYLFFKFTYILLRNLKKVGDIKFFTKRSLLIFCALNDGRKGKLGRTI